MYEYRTYMYVYLVRLSFLKKICLPYKQEAKYK